MKAIRNFRRHLRDGIRNLFRNGWMTIATIFTMTLTLIMVGGFVFLMANVNTITANIEQSFQVRVTINAIATPQEEQQLQKEIEQIAHVTKVTYRTKDQELEDIIQNVGSEFALHEGDSNPLLNVFVIDVDSPEHIKIVNEAASKLKNVDQATYGGLDSDTVLRNLEMVRYIVAVIATIFVIIAILLVSNTIRMTIASRRVEIEIMRLVGATKGYVRAPFKHEGAFIGLISAMLAVIGLFLLYEGAQYGLPQVLGLANLDMVPTLPLLQYIAAGLLALGWILGVFGASRSVKKYLNY